MQRLSKNIDTKECLRIGELATITGVRISTLKYYAEIGILPYNQADTRLSKQFDRGGALARLDAIKKLKDDGKTITEIKSVLTM